MAELSPQAQAALDAFLRAPCSNRLSVAATLRAAALYCKRDTLILLAIADELEAQP